MKACIRVDLDRRRDGRVAKDALSLRTKQVRMDLIVVRPKAHDLPLCIDSARLVQLPFGVGGQDLVQVKHDAVRIDERVRDVVYLPIWRGPTRGISAAAPAREARPGASEVRESADLRTRIAAA